MTKLSLIFIILIGGLLRLINLDISPPSLNWDEAAWGYNAYSISYTLKDEYGVTLPIFTRSFDEYKSTLPLYLMIPSIRIFGLNETGVRFPSALIGSITILLVFLIAKELFKSEKIALVSSFVFSIEPWSVHFSRTYHDANIALFLFLLGFLLLLYSAKINSLLPLSMFSFMLSMYTYNANKLIVPLFLVILIYLRRKSLIYFHRKIILFCIIILISFSLPFIVLTFLGQTFPRIDSTNIFVLFKTEAEGLKLDHPVTGIVDILIHNKYFYFIWDIVGRYFSYFSPKNLFLREPQEPGIQVAGNSLFHPFEFSFWVIGIIFLFKNFRKQKELSLLLLISSVPAMLTWNWFQPSRVMSLLFVYSILIGVGTIKFFEYLKHPVLKIILSILFIFISFSSIIYLYDSLMVYLPFRDSGSWQPGFRETVPVVYKLSQNYSQVIIETSHAQPYIFYLFYSQYPPEQYLKEIDLKKIGTPRKYYDFGKFKFRKIYWPDDKNLTNTLFVGNDYNLPQKDIEKDPNSHLVTEVKDKKDNIIAKIVATN